jgi:hypothetical protein
MKCPAPELLAEAVTSNDDEVLRHVADCVQCQELLDGQREIHGLLAALPDRPLTRAHRESLAAEVLAHADIAPAARRRRLVPILAIGVALAAIIALVAYLPNRGQPDEPVAAVPPPTPAPAPPRITPLPEPPPVAPAPEETITVISPAPPPAAPAVAKAKIGGDGEFAREARGDRDVVNLTGGDVTVDSVGARAVSVVHGDTSVVAKSAKATVVAKRGVIAQVTVIAGSVEVTVGTKRVVIEQGMTWERNASREDSLAAFRTGWEALRAGDNAAAIAAFDQATDEVVAEDALYWSAIASERLHDDTGAVKRYRALIEKFPKSPRVAAAEAAIARLAP